jgi:hypothetical protein
MYRIEWKSLITNYTSHGDWFDAKDKQILEDHIKYMNEKHFGEIKHWLVNQ